MILVLERAIKNGETPEEKISYAIQLPETIRRRYYDDTTVIVIFFDSDKIASLDNFELTRDKLSPNPFHIVHINSQHIL